MGNSSSSSTVMDDGNCVPANDAVYTLPTPTPDVDADRLMALFPQAQRDDNGNDIGRGMTILTWQTMTLFLPKSHYPQRIIACMNLQQEHHFMNCPTRTVHGITIRELVLPSGSAMVLVPPQLLRTKIHRQAVAAFLQNPVDTAATEKENCNPAKARSIHHNDSSIDQDAPVVSIPSLEAVLTHTTNTAAEARLNARGPVPFQTDLFEGHYLLVVRPESETTDPYWHNRVFAHKKRRLIWQIQGRFRRKPRGIVYAGAELDQPMKLGLVTRGAARILLKLVESFNSNVHYSFGSSEQQNSEASHIVVPAYTAFERIVATPPGETPPTLGEPVDETTESMKYRKESRSVGEWNTTDTYTLEFFSMYIDLARWTLVNLPVSGDISLRTFWGDSKMQLCLYDMPVDKDKHTDENKDYAFAIQMKFLGDNATNNSNHSNAKGIDGNAAYKEKQQNKNQQEDVFRWTNSQRPVPFVRQEISTDNSIPRRESRIFTIGGLEEGEEEGYFFDAEETYHDGDEEGEMDTIIGSSSVDETILSVELDLLSQIDKTCPFWMEVCNTRGGYSKVFALATNSLPAEGGGSNGNANKSKLGLWPASACEELLQGKRRIRRTVDKTFSPRLSSSEWTRRAVGVAFQDSFQGDVSAKELDTFMSHRSVGYEKLLLCRAQPSTSDTKSSTGAQVQDFVARAISDRHWIEEWATLNAKRIQFFHPEKQKSHFQLSIESIVRVEVLDDVDCPYTDYPILAIHTVGRTVYLMFQDRTALSKWEDAITQLCFSNKNEEPSSNAIDTAEAMLDNPAAEFMHKSTMWRCKNRRILNCALFSFHSKTSDPLELVQDALKSVLTLATTSNITQTPGVAEKRRFFLEKAAKLKDASLEGMNEDRKLAFYLNLYHTMISHAFLILGPPNWSLQWINYFNNIAYQVGDEIFSLTELEHCIIRVQMSAPAQFLSRFAIPKSNYGRLALSRKDHRINFALNCGSLSNPDCVPCYDEHRLNEQLNAASRLYLRDSASLSQSKSCAVITLPRICQWFRNDFGATDDELINTLSQYLSDEAAIEGEQRSLTIRHAAYQFECRPFGLLVD